MIRYHLGCVCLLALGYEILGIQTEFGLLMHLRMLVFLVIMDSEIDICSVRNQLRTRAHAMTQTITYPLNKQDAKPYNLIGHDPARRKKKFLQYLGCHSQALLPHLIDIRFGISTNHSQRLVCETVATSILCTKVTFNIQQRATLQVCVQLPLFFFWLHW